MGTLSAYLLPLQVEEEAGNPFLEPSPGLMIWTLVMFAITLYILKRYAFGPLGAVLEKRRKTISESLDEAEQSRAEAGRLLEDYRVRVGEARREADTLREKARKDAERQTQEILEEAHRRRERVLADAQGLIDAQTRQAAGGLRDDVVALALLAAERVTRASLDDAEHRRLIEEAIRDADLSRLAAAGDGGGARPGGV